MAESDSFTRRQSISEANHVNRIRTSHSKRLSVLLSSTEKVNYLESPVPSQHEENGEKGMSDSNSRRKSHCEESLEELRIRLSNNKEKDGKLSFPPHPDTTRRSSIAGTIPKERKTSLSSNTRSGRRRTSAFQTTAAGSNKSRKASTVKNETQARRKSSLLRNSSIKNNKTGTNRTSNRKLSIPIKGERSKSIDKQRKFSSPSSKSKFDKLVEICDSKGNIVAKDLPSMRDVVILKWLHELNCPLSEKVESVTDSSEAKRSPIRILKKVTKSSVSKSKDQAELKTDEPDEADSKEAVARCVSDVEMHVSELGKLQIILNTKDLSPEDAAIVIWIDDIPRSFFTPEYSRRLSLAPEPHLLTLGIPTEAIRSQSSSELEDTPSTKPVIHFPPVTILKDTALSKYGLRKLSDYGDNSALYKRCNIPHIEWQMNGQ